MPNVEVQRILEYKLYRNTDYVLVLWKDGTTSWTKVLGLKCKDIICGFVSGALRTLRESEKHTAEQSRQEKEAKLLDKILMRNLEELQSAEIKQSEIINSIMDDRKPRPIEKTSLLCHIQSTPLEGAGIPGYSVSASRDEHFTAPHDRTIGRTPATKNRKLLARYYCDSQQAMHRPFVQTDKSRQICSAERQRSNMPYEKPYTKRASLEATRVNSLLINVDRSTSLVVNFYFRETLPMITIDVSTASFVGFDALASHLYSIYLSGGGFSFFPSEDPETAPRTAFENHMRSNRLFLVKKHCECVWILYAPDTRDDLFKIATNSRFFIFRIEGDSFLNDLCAMTSFVGENTTWARGTFKFGAGMLGDFLYRDATFPRSKSIFLFGNFRLMRHLLSFAKNRGEIVDSIESASAVLIQNSYLDFLHQIPGFYDSLRKHTKFFLEDGLGFEEILVSGGMVTFSNEFIEEFELLAVADLIGVLCRRKNWEVRIKRSTYAILKRRLAAQQCAPEYLSKMKSIYRVFKNSILEGFEGNLRDHLESRYYKTHRFFLEVSLLKVADGTVTVDEALRLVMST